MFDLGDWDGGDSPKTLFLLLLLLLLEFHGGGRVIFDALPSMSYGCSAGTMYVKALNLGWFERAYALILLGSLEVY